MSAPKWTPAQRAAIEDRGGTLLVSAAAGSGKTAVLVERAVRLITDAAHPVAADRLLIVTFTRAAAEELRGRIAVRLAAEAAAHPESAYLRRQRLLLGRANICTIDAFCMQLLKRYFAELGLPPDFELADDAKAYTLRQNALSAVLRGVGDSRTPLYFLIGSSISNILLDIFFVVWLKMGVAGVAWATFAAQGAASVLAFLTLLHRIKQLRSTEPYAKFSAEMLVQVTIVAIPSILQQCFVSVGNLFVQSAVNSYGSAVVAGFSACQKLNTFAVTCMTTLSNGVSSFTAQNLGADKKERISEGFRAGTLLGILVCVPFFLFYFFFGRTAMGLFLDESSAAAIQAGVDYMHIVTPFYFIVTIKVMCDGVLRGGSAMLYFMTTTFTDLFLRVALAFLFAKGLGLGATGIWMAWPFGWTLSALLSIFFYRLKPWLKKEL